MSNAGCGELAERVSKLLEKEKLSISRFSQLSGIPASTLKDLLNGRSRSANFETIKKIASGFNLSVRDFFNNEIFD